MGVCFSTEHQLKPTGFSGKAIMAFTYEGSNIFRQINFLDLINSLTSYSSFPVIIIEPTHGAKPPIIKVGPPSISYVETMRSLHQTYKVSQFKFASFRLWLLISESISSAVVSDVISDCRTYPFADFFSTKAFTADDLFFDVSNVGSFAATFKPPTQCGGLRSSSPLRTAAQINSNTFIVRRSHDAVALQTTFKAPNPVETAYPISKSNDCDFVINGLFIGGEAAARNKSLLQRLGITHIVNLNSGDSLVDEYDDYTYCSILLNDSVFEDLTPEFWNAINFIDNAIRQNGAVLVHCRRGISRSAALVVAYLMDCRGMKLEAAMSFLKKQRPIVNINQGFVEQLQSHEEQKLKETRVSTPHTPRFGLRLTVF
ncbi:Dual specificity phosphatase, catalytic domain containing protein [Tritrichomonas foetus]|uniref:protein-tyrosine-phosphatase n=1 Tax=Tritrichomonas foetus TaxID=1144522 RepID=A0A1J4KW87_9EUKA|nr:Dual specificity phosphatase, catalytic domain containing protein [Tritrichomonas foetus]|eukprot:OHT13789.1 Dual specificity phosphatase, catalytic domain containing protein [Tritrichomonas foetus]